MPARTIKTGQPARLGEFRPWLAIAVVATLAGLFAPQLLPGETALSPSIPKSEAKGVGSLDYKASALPEAPNFRAMMLRLGAGTILVLGLCVASLWAARRWLNPAISGGADARAMRLIETLQLGNRCCLHLVHLGSREMIVGVDGGGIKTVLPLAEPFGDVLAAAEKAPSATQRHAAWAEEGGHES